MCGDTHVYTGVHTEKCAGLVNESENLSHRFDTLWHTISAVGKPFSSGCMLGLIGGCWVIFSCARGPSACPPRPHHRSSLSLSATATLELARGRPRSHSPLLYALNARHGASWMQGGSLLNQHVSPTLKLCLFIFPLLLLLIPQTIFILKVWQLLHPHTYTVLFSSLPVQV